MKRVSLPLFLLLGGVLCGLETAPAQTNRAPIKTTAKTRIAPNSQVPISWLFGEGIGALLLGGALGYALRKPVANSKGAAHSAGDFFDGAPFPLAIVDENEKISRRNAAFERFFGARVGFPELFHPEDLGAARVQIAEILGGARDDFALDCRFFGADGGAQNALLQGQKAGGRRAEKVLLSWRDTTAQRRAEVELGGARAAIGALYEVIAGDKTRDLDAKIKSLLALGCGRFELPIGVLGRLTPTNLETLWVQSADRRVRPMMTISRAGSAHSGETALLGLEWLPTRANWKRLPFIAKNEGGTYFGAPIIIENELFGMLSFSGLEARQTAFDNAEIELLQLMADWVGGEIERHDARETLEKQQIALLDANEKLEKLATHDALTGAKNRRAFTEKLDEEWSRAQRYGTPLSLVMLDVDHFKLFNDSFGHPAGDVVLQRVAGVLLAAVRVTDFLARYGGEEFVLVLPNTDAGGALILAERLRAGIERAPWKERPVTASIGVCSLNGTHKTAAALLQSADLALYRSKQNGRNRVTHAAEMATEPVEPDAEK